MQLLKEKQEKARLENITDSEQTIAELNRRYDRDKQILLEENKKLNCEVESVSFCLFSFTIYILWWWYCFLLNAIFCVLCTAD